MRLNTATNQLHLKYVHLLHMSTICNCTLDGNMKSFKNQFHLRHVVGPTLNSLQIFDGPQVRKPIHKPKPNRWTKVKCLVHEYCSYSTIHGMGYIGSRRKSPLERLWWFTVFAVSVCGCSLLIHEVYQKWSNNPVIVTFDDHPVPVWMLPFPAVTICPGTKIRRKAMNFTADFYQFIDFEGSRENLDKDRFI